MQATQRLAQLAARCSAATLLRPQEAGLLAAASQRLLCRAVQRQCVQQLHGSSWQQDEEVASAGELERRALINRMLYRSRQRGFLELDLLIGMWAERELPRMSSEVLREFEVVLDQENPDMFKWLTAQEHVPEELKHNRAFQGLQAHVQAMTDQHHSVPPAAGEAPKAWVCGWTDTGKELGGGAGVASSSSSNSTAGS